MGVYFGLFFVGQCLSHRVIMVCILVMVRLVWKPFLGSFLWDFCFLLIPFDLLLLQIGVGGSFSKPFFIYKRVGRKDIFLRVWCFVLFCAFFLLGGYFMITDVTNFFGGNC